jgi:transposase
MAPWLRGPPLGPAHGSRYAPDLTVDSESQRARARGHDHPHAIRILGRAWLRIIWRLWQDHNTYDPNRHGSLNRLLATKG